MSRRMMKGQASYRRRVVLGDDSFNLFFEDGNSLDSYFSTSTVRYARYLYKLDSDRITR